MGFVWVTRRPFGFVVTFKLLAAISDAHRAPRLMADLPPSRALLAASCAFNSVIRALLASNFLVAFAFLARAFASPTFADATLALGALAFVFASFDSSAFCSLLSLPVSRFAARLSESLSLRLP